MFSRGFRTAVLGALNRTAGMAKTLGALNRTATLLSASKRSPEGRVEALSKIGAAPALELPDSAAQ
jgi:hypothetical protein